MPLTKPRIMFLCTGNSCRSQMAEGFARYYGGEHVDVFSAGLEPHGVNPRAISVMQEVGVDISSQTSDEIDPKLLASMDYGITLCSNAEQRCPMVPAGVTRLHWPFDDPAQATGTPEEILNEFRRVRDEIKEKILSFYDELGLLKG